MKKILSLLLTLTLIAVVPLSATAGTEAQSVSVSISSGLNNDAIATVGDKVTKNYTFPTYLYNSAKFTNPMTVNGIAYNFVTDNEAFKVRNSDSITLNSQSYTATVTEDFYKKIGFIAFSNADSAVNATVKITYQNGETELHDNISVKTATDNSGTSFGKSLVSEKVNSLNNKAVEGSNELYLNAYEITVEKASKVKSIEFSQGNYVIFAVSALKYTQDELDEISSGAITAHWEKYKDKNITQISDSDVENIKTLYNGLVTAKANGTNTEIATDENITRIGNLSDGYALYKTKKGYSEYFENAYATKDYKTLSATDITDSDIKVIEEIIAKYTEAESFDETKYGEILTYFELTDTFNTYDLSDKTTLVTLKTSYEFNKAEKENQDAIKAIFDLYKDKTTSDLTESDVTELDKLIALYETAETNGYSYSTDDYEKIKKLRNNYVNYKNSENDICYDLSSYFTGSVVANNGDTSATFGFPDSNGRVGWSVTDFSKYIKNGYIPAKNNFNFTYDGYLSTSPQIERETLAKEVNFKASTDLTANGKNAVIFSSATDKSQGFVNSVTIKSPQRISKRIAFLFGVGKSDVYLNVNVKYTDGEKYTQSWRTRWAGHEASTTLDQGGKLYRTGSSSNIEAMSVNGSQNKVMARGLILDIPEGKIVESVTVSSSATALLGISEIPISNADFTSKLETQWNIVKDYDAQTITSAQLPDTNKMILYVDECEKRGINPETYGIDVEKVDSFREMNLTATPSIFRADRNTVKAEFAFSVPVTQTDIKNKLTVTKNGSEFTDYKTEFSTDGKKLTLIFDETKNGGNEYNVTLSSGLSIAKFPSITLGNDSTISYTVPDYTEYSYDGSKFTVKNNSKETVKGYVGVTVFETDEKTVAYADLKSCTVNGEDSADVSFDTTAYTDKIKKTVLWDENMNVISNGSEIKACTSDVVATADYKEPAFDMKDNSVRLNGFTATKKAGELVSLKVVDEKSNIIVFVGSQKTAKDGYFDFKFIMSSAASKTLTFTIGGDGFSAPETLTKTIFYFAPGERENYIESLKGMSETDLTTEIPAMKTKLAIAFDPANKISDSDYAKMIIANSDMLVSTDVAKTQTNLKKLAVIKAFSGNNSSLLMSGNEFKYDEIMNYSSIDTDGVTLYSILKNGISDKGIAKFKEDVFNKNYANEKELLLAIKQSIFLNAINYPKNSGVGYIVDLLTAKNAQSAQIVIDKYLNNASYAFNSAIAQKAGSFNTLAEVGAFIANYTVPSNSGNLGGVVSSTPSGGTAGGHGGSVSGGFSSNVNEEPTYTFSDVTKTHWAYENIMSLYNKGIISGKASKTFAPEDTVTRGELIKMICTAYGLKAVNSGKFTDAKDKWYEEYAQAGYDNGLITGISENDFGGDMPVSRQDICTILYRIAKGNPTLALTFVDSGEISDYAKNAVAFMVEKGIVNGFTDNTFAPLNNCTRAQASKIIDMFLQMN